MNKLITNPFSVYVKRSLNALLLEFKYRRQNLRIGYLACAYNCKFGKNNTLYDYSLLSKVELGDFTYVSSNTNMANTKVGKFCSIAQNVQCGLGMHPASVYVSTHPIFYSTKKQCGLSFAENDHFEESKLIIIGNDVWIGANSIVLDGVTIGDGAIIGAGAVVTKDVPPYAIMGGVPAKLIRYRFSNKDIEFLLKNKWWNKDITWLKENYSSTYDIKNFKRSLRKK
ncbi:MAG: CatB-related O-acetyltransferase [Patescibacteria group bacterium]